jgi:hypothetical protein
VPADLEKLAYESALRALDKQERLVEELRARTGLILAASTVAGSLLGHGFDGPGSGGLTILVVACFVVSVSAAIFILLPRDDLMFSVRGIQLYEGLVDSRDTVESLLRAAAGLDRLWLVNEAATRLLTRAFSVAATALAIEVAALAVLLGGTII